MDRNRVEYTMSIENGIVH